MTTSTIVETIPTQLAAESTAVSARPQRRTPDETSERVGVLFHLLGELDAGGVPDVNLRYQLREELVQLHTPLVEHLVRRFRNRGESEEDLFQVAMIGLLKAIDGFSLDRGTEFSSYAVPTVVGEIKRWFRDKGWAVHVPRRLKELKLEVREAAEALAQKLGRTPTTKDLAGYLGITEIEVLEGFRSAQAYSTQSIAAPLGSEHDLTLADVVGDEDEGMRTVEDRESLRPLIRQLPERQQRIVGLRFFQNMTQSQIAREVGISQMHVSRLLNRSLSELRAGLAAAS